VSAEYKPEMSPAERDAYNLETITWALFGIPEHLRPVALPEDEAGEDAP